MHLWSIGGVFHLKSSIYCNLHTQKNHWKEEKWCKNPAGIEQKWSITIQFNDIFKTKCMYEVYQFFCTFEKFNIISTLQKKSLK